MEATLREGTVTREGVSIAFRELAGDKPPIILLHGLSSTKNIWNLVTPYLQPHHVVSYDQRGHGESGHPPDGYDFGSVTGDLEHLLTALDIERGVIVGHSWGASVALEFAATRPHRTAGLALVDGGITELSSRPNAKWEETREQLRPPDIDGWPAGELLERMERNFPVWSDAIAEIVLASYFINEGRIARRFPIPQHMQVVEALWHQKTMALYSDVRCPVLLLPAFMDSREAAAAQMAGKRQGIEQVLRIVQDAHLHPFDETIHDIPLQRPEDLAAVLKDFTASLQAD
jgi:pimeloyl-ACP methyl ester carboxylesterase